MSKHTSASELLDQIEFLFERYSYESRSNTQPFYLAKVNSHFPEYKYKPDDHIARETLIEHIGSLPMVATAFYPHINDPQVNLGEALVMLAIHDIGELITGDVNTFIKKDNIKDPEREAAKTLLNPYYHKIYDDVESQTSQTAKFAKAIDKITPDILDYLTPVEITIRRLKHFTKVEPNQIVKLIVNHKRPYMTWNPFMAEFHALLMDKLASRLKAWEVNQANLALNH